MPGIKAPILTTKLADARLSGLTLLACAIVLNVAIGQLARNVLRLPIYLDSIGTILAAVLGGPLAGIAAGALSNVVWGIMFQDPGIVPFALTAACIGACAAGAASLGAFKHISGTVLAGLITGAIAALVSAPISAYVQQASNGAGQEALQKFLASTSDNVLQAVTLQGFVSDPLDKTISFLVVYGLLRILPRWIHQPLAEARSLSRSRRVSARYGVALILSVIALVCVAVFRPAFGTDVFAIFYLAVVLGAWYGGLGPGMLAGAIGLVTSLTLQAPPLGPGLGVQDWLRVVIFVCVAFLVALITDRLDRTNSALGGALAELRDQEAMTRAVADSVVEALVLVSPAEQRVLRVNHQFETLFSVPTADVVGRRMEDLEDFVGRVFAEPEQLRGRVADTTNDQTATYTDTFKQVWPEERLLAMFSTPVLSQGAFLGRLFGFRDVTQERELDRMKTEFVSQVSHELRTPLTAIKGFTDMVLDGDAGDINEEQSEYLGIVRSNVDRLMALINDLLDIARIESGRVQLKLEQTDLASLLKLVEKSMQPLVEGKHQTLRSEIEHDLPPVLADRDRVVQVLTNLVSNAHKYTQDGGAIVVRARTQDGLARIEVQDNGMGIPTEDIPRLFSRFFRVDSSLTREIGGTGLGLSIVKSIVELHGGTVSVDSSPGNGSTFAFTLPVARVGSRVLVVDDDVALADYLSRAGYNVQVASDAALALTSCQQERPDVILLRLRRGNRGHLDGADSLAEAAEGSGIPLLVVSHTDAQADMPRPPFDDVRVIDRVQHALTRSDHRRVLVVEDDAAIRLLLQANLSGRGFEALEAPDGETGLLLAAGQQPDLVILDLNLPGIDGFTVLQQLKHNPATASIPVIAVTGDEELLLGARARVLALGAADFVEKPFQMDALIEEIRALSGDKERDYVDSRAGR